MSSDIHDGLSVRRASVEDISLIRSMAGIVFRQTYASILSPEQMEYMMDWMYSEESLKEQVCGDSKEFYVAELDGDPAGYVSFELEKVMEDGRNLYHLQKLYVMPRYQRKGIGGAMLHFVTDTLSERNPHGCRVELNVNRNNAAVGFYERMGLFRDREGDFPIGCGYYMNDYIYASDIQGK